MPRNGSGVYTLPGSNPVVPNTTIATTWANPTLEDIATALTDSLSRTGSGGMTGVFKITNGTVNAPGLAFTDEVGLGLYRTGTNVFKVASNGAAVFTFEAGKATSPVRTDFYGYVTYRLAGSYNWKVYDNSGDLTIAPSTAVDGDTYDATKATVFDSATGLVTVPSLAVTGNLSAGSWTYTDIIADSIDAPLITGTKVQFDQNVINANSVSDSASINFAVSQSWVVTLTAPLTITSITNLDVGNIGRITFINTTHAVTFPATVKWPAPSFAQPSFSAGPIDRVVVVLEWDGTNFLANAAVY